MSIKREELQKHLAGALPPELIAALESGDEARARAILKKIPTEQKRLAMRQIGGLMPDEVVAQLGIDKEKLALLDGLRQLPPEIMNAFMSGDVEQIRAAIAILPEEQQQNVMRQFQSMAGQAGASAANEPQEEGIQKQLATLALAIAGVARGNDTRRKEIETALPRLEQAGWKIIAPVQAIWAGVRDEKKLTAGIDLNSAELVRRILQELSP